MQAHTNTNQDTCEFQKLTLMQRIHQSHLSFFIKLTTADMQYKGYSVVNPWFLYN